MAEAQPVVRRGGPAGSPRRGRAASLKACAAPLLAAALAGCAVGGLAPPDAAAPVALAPGLAIAGATGPLPLSRWLPEGEPRAVILALHGYGDYAESAFGEVAEAWARRGIAVYGYDQRGFGRGPYRGRWPGAEALVADAAAAARAAADAAGDAPLFLLGESMGGGVALTAVGEGLAPEVDGLILVAPAIAPGDRVNPLSRAALWLLAMAAPDRRWSGEGLVEVQASDDLAMLRKLGADPVYLSRPSARELAGLVRLMDRASAVAGRVRVPTLLLLGEKDELIDIEAAAEAAARALGPVDARRYPEGWHMLLRDLQKSRVWDDVAEWTLAQAETRFD